MILDGKYVSSLIKEEIKAEVALLSTKPKIVDIQIGDNDASEVYIKNKEKASMSVGIEFECVRFSKDTKESIIIDKIHELNNDSKVNGILIQSPIPSNFNFNKLVNEIDYRKDVDGLTNINIGRLVNKEESLISCTPMGIIKLLEYYKIEVFSKHVVIVGRSNLVGKPLIQLFLNMDATVTICHSKTDDLKKYTKEADILVVAVGKKHLIKKDMVKENSTIIDVGINKENDVLYGDVDFEGVKDIVKYITPVPGGVGPMTVAMLLFNTLKSYKSFR